MQHLNTRKPLLVGCSAALLLGLSFPVLAGSGGHGDGGHHDMANMSAEHDKGHEKAPQKAVVKAHDNSDGHHGSNHDAHGEADQHDNMMADTVMARVVSIDAANGRLTLDHEALTNIGMDAMTMGFQLDEGVSARGLKSGDKVQATVEMKPGKGFVITEVSATK